MTLELNSRKARLNEQNPVGSCAAGRLGSGAFFHVAARICRKMGGAGRCLVHRACAAQRKDRASPKERFNSASETGQCGTTKKLVPHKLGSYAERERVLEPELCLPQTALLVPQIDLTPCLLKFSAVRPVLLCQGIEVPLEQVDLGHNVPGPVSNVLGGCRRGLVRCPFLVQRGQVALELLDFGFGFERSGLRLAHPSAQLLLEIEAFAVRPVVCVRDVRFARRVDGRCGIRRFCGLGLNRRGRGEGLGEYNSRFSLRKSKTTRLQLWETRDLGSLGSWGYGWTGRTHRCYGRHSVLLRSIGSRHDLECRLA